MRRLISFVLLLGSAGGIFFALWTWKIPATDYLNSWWMEEKKSWIEKPATHVVVSLSGDDLAAMDPVSKKVGALLASFDGRMKRSSQDSPASQIDLSATLAPAAVLPIRDLVQHMVEAEVSARPPAKPAGLPRRSKSHRAARKSTPARAAGMSAAQTKKWREFRQRKDALMKTWAEAENDHERLMESQKEIRHPDELLKGDDEARDLKRKLVDLEMTLAEVIDHYTPAHPRVRDIQQEISALRSALDRRVLVAQEVEQNRWARRAAEFKRKKIMLDREEKQLSAMPAAAAPKAVQAEEDRPASEPPPEEEPPAVRPVSMKVAWTETQATVKELVSEKQINIQKLSMGISAMIAAGLLIGYLLGMIGGGSHAGAAAGPVELDRAMPLPPPPAAETSAAPKARKPLPAITAAPPPAPEKIIEEDELPGDAWVTVPMLPPVEKGLYTVFAPTSAASEIFSKAAENLLNWLPKPVASQVVTVASIRSGSGTSTFVANLAVALLPHRPVLLVDLHHTAPHLHTFFSVPASSQDLMASTPWTQSIVPTPVDRLSLLPLFSPHLEKEMADLKLKKRLQPFLKENSPDRLVLLDLAPLGRSDLFEEVAEVSDAFLLLIGPEPVPDSAKKALARLVKAMKKKPILRVVRVAQSSPDALAPRPPAEFEFAG